MNIFIPLPFPVNTHVSRTAMPFIDAHTWVAFESDI